MDNQPPQDDSRGMEQRRSHAELFSLLIDGKFTDSDSRELEALLTGNPELQREFVDFLLVHDHLDERLGTEGLIGLVDMLSGEDGELPTSIREQLLPAAADSEESDPTRKLVDTKADNSISGTIESMARGKFGFALAIAAGLILAVYISGSSLFRGQPTDSELASIETPSLGSEEVVPALAYLREDFQVQFSETAGPDSGQFHAGQFNLEHGAAGLVFSNGAELILQAPAEFEIIDDMTVKLERGNLRVHVPDSAIGFTVITPEFEVEDLGTEFGVTVDQDRTSQVHVFAGKVRLWEQGELLKELTRGAASRRAGQWQQAVQKSDRAYLTPADVGYRRWLEHQSQLVEDSSLIFYYDFEHVLPGRKSITSTAGSLSSLSATLHGGAVVQGRWPGTRALLIEESEDHLSLDIPGRYRAFTITAWIQLHSLSWLHQTILSTNEWPQNTHHLNVLRDGSLDIGLKRSASGNLEDLRLQSNAGLLQVGSWAFVSAVVDAGAGHVRYYVNGEEILSAEVDFPEPFLSFGPSSIGNWGHTPDFAPGGPLFYNRPLCGRIDDIAVYNRALSQEEILSEFRAGNGYR